MKHKLLCAVMFMALVMTACKGTTANEPVDSGSGDTHGTRLTQQQAKALMRGMWVSQNESGTRWIHLIVDSHVTYFDQDLANVNGSHEDWKLLADDGNDYSAGSVVYYDVYSDNAEYPYFSYRNLSDGSMEHVW